MGEYQTAISLLAVFTTAIPALYVNWGFGKLIGKHTVASGFGMKQIVKQRRGVNLIFINLIVWGLVWWGLSTALESAFGNDLTRIVAGYIAAIPGLYIAARVYAGYKFSLLSGLVHGLAAVGLIALFLYAVGFDYQQFVSAQQHLTDG